MAQQVKNPPVTQETQETWVWFLDPEDPLEKEMATCSSILTWEIPWTEEPGGLPSKGSLSNGWAAKPAHCLCVCVLALLKDLFLYQPTLNLYWTCYDVACVVCVPAFWPWALWDLSSQTGGRICTPATEKWSLNHWSPGKPLYISI